MGILIRWIVTFIAVFVASALLRPSGLFRIDSLGSGAVFAAILALLNAFVRPFVMTLTCPIQILTLGLSTLLVNAVIFIVAERTAHLFGAGVTVGGFFGALIAAIVVSLVSWVVSIFVRG